MNRTLQSIGILVALGGGVGWGVTLDRSDSRKFTSHFKDDAPFLGEVILFPNFNFFLLFVGVGFLPISLDKYKAGLIRFLEGKLLTCFY